MNNWISISNLTIKHKQEEEQRAKLKLAHASNHQQKHLESRKMKRAVSEDRKKAEEHQKVIADMRKSVTKEAKERKVHMKDKLSSFEQVKKKEIDEVKQKKEYIKKLNERQREDMKVDNFSRADSQRKTKVKVRAELEKFKEKVQKQRQEERKSNKQQNEDLKSLLKDIDQQNKAEQVKQIRKNRMSLELVQTYLARTNQEKVFDSIQYQLRSEEEAVKDMARMIEQLKQEELHAARRLEKTHKNLEHVGSELSVISPMYQKTLSI
jgi:hypothetical protein